MVWNVLFLSIDLDCHCRYSWQIDHVFQDSEEYQELNAHLDVIEVSRSVCVCFFGLQLGVSYCQAWDINL